MRRASLPRPKRSSVPAVPRDVATPREPTAPPARGVFWGFALRGNPPKADSSTSASNRGRDDSPPAAPSKKARADAGSAADPAGTGASGAAITPTGDPAPTKVAPATGDTPPAVSHPETPAGTEEEVEAPPAGPTALQGPSEPASGVGAIVVDLDSDVEVTGASEEPEVAPAPSPAAPAAVTTAATGTVPGDAPAVTDAVGADLSAAQQGTAVTAAAIGTAPGDTLMAMDAAELYRRLEAQRAELQGALDSMVAAQAATKKEHAEVIAAAQARIDEKSDLIANYLGENQGLRVKLEVQVKATESTVKRTKGDTLGATSSAGGCGN
ncbi:predicted GPI-anchored protein 58 [Brachypodium distachyon]|uniref:predicted GPI-anchored protein 58 n=1 Tax=Brachypodium distachyon TaxID=15368 RepID=UPI00052FFC3B|nr:predicted GPI-anchored protein 58 [Brachypodium distachyon]|eukprot:XP_010230238.1 predicted GPI-anchored protein 58 [Brachypodium distachyon]